MKNLFGIFFSISLLLSSLAGAIIGLFMMAYQLYSGEHEFLPGFQIFSLSSILFIVTIIAYMTSKIVNANQIISESLLKLVDREIEEIEFAKNTTNSLFGNMFGGGSLGTIQVSKIDDKGNISPFSEKEFNTPEEFFSYRNELIAKALGHKPEDAEKKLEEMTIDELRSEEKKAVDSQSFEAAAAIRDAIEEKKGKRY